jgi:hypothetical protein
MELPRPLMPWGQYLELLPSELATALGPLIQRLDLVIGPLQASTRHSDGDPDGFHGITRRGSYERLLISEWMLAEEFPEEFARRAVMGELGFLELARRQRVGGRTSVALFDAGPDQLGGPRIVHLAALIVLARRAEGTGACFQWGMLQQPAGTLHTSLTVGTLWQLFQARSYRSVADQDVAAWREHVGSQVGADDIWLIGGPRLSDLPAATGASLLQVIDPYLPEANHLNAVVTDRGRVKPTVTLELPSSAICTRLLRDPFATRRATPSRAYSRFAPTSNLLFMVGGKLMARAGADHIIVYPIPNSPHAIPGKPKVYHTDIPRPIFSAGRSGNRMVLITSGPEPHTLDVEYVGRKSSRFQALRLRIPPRVGMVPPQATDPLTPCFPIQGSDGEQRWLIIVGNILLHSMAYENSPKVKGAIVEAESVHAAAPTSSGWSFVTKENSKWMLIYVRGEGRTQRIRLSDFRYHLLEQSSGGGFKPTIVSELLQQSFDRSVVTILFGFSGHLDDSLIAIQESHDEWSIGTLNHTIILRSDADDMVVGVTAITGEGIAGSHSSEFEAGLILLRKDRRRITVMGQNWVRSVPSASSPIVQFAANPYGPEIAYLTEKGELVVYSLQQEAVLCRFLTGETP